MDEALQYLDPNCVAAVFTPPDSEKIITFRLIRTSIVELKVKDILRSAFNKDLT